MPHPVPIAIFGAGRWGAHLVRNFLNHPEANVVAVIDPNPDRLAALANRLDLGQTKTYTDWTAIAHLDVQAVVIATPAVTHYSLIRTALERGLHVLAEKPLTLNVQECIDLCQLAEQHQRQLVIDHTYLFHPAVQQGQQTLKHGAVGQFRYGYATRTHLGPVRQDVDALWDLAIHDLAIFNSWLNELPCQVQAQGTVWLQPQIQSAPLFPTGLADLVWVKLTYPSGFQAVIHLCWTNPDKQRRLALVGDRGTLIFDELAETPLVLQQGEFDLLDGDRCALSSHNPAPKTYNPTNLNRQVIPLTPTEPLREVCQHFLTCIQTQTPSSLSSGWLGTNLVQVLTDLTTSLNQGGKEIKVTYPHP